jgi:hypothetical protein
MRVRCAIRLCGASLPSLDGARLAGSGESEEQGIKVRDYWGPDPITGDVVRIILAEASLILEVPPLRRQRPASYLAGRC